MIVPVRLFDGTVFDFDTKYIVYNTAQPVEYGEKTVYPSVLSPNFVIDYSVPKYLERSESEHDLVDRVTCVARHSLGLQLSCSPITVELLTPEKAYEQIDNLEKIFMHKFYIDYFSYSFNSRFIKLISSKRWAVCYIMSVYGVNTLGDPIGLPSYFVIIQSVVFVLTFFIWSYINIFTIFVSYFLYGSIKTREIEKMDAKQEMKTI